jgi:hypothetical protein
VAEQLGTAVLELQVDARAATQALETFRGLVEGRLANLGSDIFSGLERDARRAGERAGNAISEGVKNSTKRLKFGDITSALEFKPQNTIKGLEQYRTALEVLRDRLGLGSQGAQQLTDRIGALSQALQRARQTTAQQAEAQLALNNALEKTRTRRQADEARENAKANKEWEASLRTITAAQKEAAKASDEAATAAAKQRQALVSLAQKGVKDVGGGLGAVGRGAAGAVRTGVNLGKGAYGLGAELGIFEDPKPGKLTGAVQSVIDRFAFLGKQAETTRGIILRSIEGIGAAAGLAKLAQNADQVRAALNGLSAAAKATDAATSGFSKIGQYLADAFNNGGWLTDNGNTIIGKILNISAAAEQGVAATASLGDQLIQLGAGVAGGALNGVESLVNTLDTLPPSAQAAVLALAGISLGFKEKPIVDGLSRVIEYLNGVQASALNVSQTLQRDLQRQLQSSGLTQDERSQKRRNADLLRDRRLQIQAERAAANDGIKQEIRDRTQANRITSAGGFGEASASNFSSADAVTKSIARNQERVAREAERQAKAYADAQRDASKLLDSDLRRAQALRQISERANQTQSDLGTGFGTFSSGIGGDAVSRSIRRNAERRARLEDRLNVQRDQLEADLARQRESRLQAKTRSKDLRTKSRDALSSGLIGGAFPLLFGQGVGASFGGGVGGAIGGALGGGFGFGLSLVGTAIGQAVDQLNERFNSLGPVLDDAAGSIDLVTQNSILSSKSQEDYAKALIDAGQSATAALAIQQEAFRTLDPTALAAGASASDAYKRALSDTQDLLGNIVSGPAQGFQSWLAGVLNLLNQVPASAQRITGPDAQRRARNSESFSAGLLSTGISAAALGFIAGGPIGSAVALTGVGLAAAGGFGISSAQQRERVAGSESVRQAEDAVTAALNRQVQLEQTIAGFRANGRSQLAGQLDDIRKIEDLRSRLLKENLNIEVGVTTGDISAQEGIKRFNDQLKQLKLGQSQVIGAYRERERVSARELSNAQSLQGLTGRALDVQREQLRVSEAERKVTEQNTALAAFREANPNASANDARLQLILSARQTALNELSTAQIETSSRIADIFKAAQESVKSITRTLQDSTAQLLSLQGSPEKGLNRFLSPSASTPNIRATYDQLLPQFQAAADAAARSAAANGNSLAAREFSQIAQRFTGQVAGFVEANGRRIGVSSQRELVNNNFADTNSFFQEFIDAQRAEQRLREDIAASNIELARAQSDLTSITGQLVSPTTDLVALMPALTQVIETLSGKDWAVNVNVSANGTATAYGDVVNGAYPT